MKKDFQAGVDTVYNKLVAVGSTPTAKTPTADVNAIQSAIDSIYNTCNGKGATPTAKTVAAINTAIGKIYTDRYNSGYNAGDWVPGLKAAWNALNSAGLSLRPIILWRNSEYQFSEPSWPWRFHTLNSTDAPGFKATSATRYASGDYTIGNVGHIYAGANQGVWGYQIGPENQLNNYTYLFIII